MTRGHRRRVAIAAAAAALSVLTTGCGDPAAATDAARRRATPVVGRFTGFPLAAPIRRPDVALTDSRGRRYDVARRTRGRVTLLFVGYTRCPDLCPLVMAELTRAVHSLTAAEQARVTVLFVTADPVRDTPAVLRAWLGRFDPRFVGLTGTTAALASVYTALGMPAPEPQSGAKDTVEHAATAYAFGTDDQARLAYDDSATPSGWAADLRRLLAGQLPPPSDDTGLAATGAVGRLGLLRLIGVVVTRRPDGSGVLSATVSNQGSPDRLIAVSLPGTDASISAVDAVGLPVPAGPEPTRIGGADVVVASGRLPTGRAVDVRLRFRDAGLLLLRVPIIGG